VVEHLPQANARQAYPQRLHASARNSSRVGGMS
jgi:hypothetical protein